MTRCGRWSDGRRRPEYVWPHHFVSSGLAARLGRSQLGKPGASAGGRQRESGMADADETLVIDIVSDVVCPWCYLGEKRLEAAIAYESGPVAVRWRPYQLDPTIPEGGLDRATYMEKKFGKS